MPQFPKYRLENGRFATYSAIFSKHLIIDGITRVSAVPVAAKITNHVDSIYRGLVFVSIQPVFVFWLGHSTHLCLR